MLGPSLSLGKISGIPLRLHWSFFLFLLWVGLTQVYIAGNIGAALMGVVFIAAIFVCVVLHELGHCLAARHYGIRTNHITLSPLGGIAALDESPRTWKEEFWVAAAGPAVNVAICALLLPWLWLNPVSLDVLAQPTASLDAFIAKLFIGNMVMVIFNLLPAFPMDGGRILRSLLESQKDRETATKIAARIGQGFAVFFALTGLFSSFVLVLIGIFIFLAAEGEYRMVRSRKRLDGITVGQLMGTRFEIVPDTHTIFDVLGLKARSGQQHFPVARDGRIVALLDRSSIGRAVVKNDLYASISDYAISDYAMATPGDDIISAEELMVKTGQMALPVFEAGKLIGMIDVSAIAACREFPMREVLLKQRDSLKENRKV